MKEQTKNKNKNPVLTHRLKETYQKSEKFLNGSDAMIFM